MILWGGAAYRHELDATVHMAQDTARKSSPCVVQSSAHRPRWRRRLDIAKASALGRGHSNIQIPEVPGSHRKWDESHTKGEVSGHDGSDLGQVFRHAASIIPNSGMPPRWSSRRCGDSYVTRVSVSVNSQLSAQTNIGIRCFLNSRPFKGA